jgi:DNA-binding transcriptional MerR regulator
VTLRVKEETRSTKHTQHTQRMFYSQSDVLDILESEGFSVTIRTLQYWRSKGLIPQLERETNEFYYTEDDLNSVRDICASANRGGRSLVMTRYLEGDKFEVERIEVVRLNDNTLRKILHTRGGGRIVMECGEDDIDALVYGSTEGR